MNANVGDWISFMQDDSICIAEVRYVRERVGGYIYYVTSAGAVHEQSVLEVRKPKEEA